ncbi:MAG: preprotein translocase subunit SecE [Propionibacteriaceae bacterium]
MADKDDLDSTNESGDPAADSPDSQAHGSHAVEPAVDGVPADADEPTFRDIERLEAEGADERSEPDEIVADADELDPVEDDDELSSEDKELVTAGAPNTEAKAGGGAEVVTGDRGRRKKDKATPRQKNTAVADRRTGPVKFLRESVSELQKVVYPTGSQLVNYFIVVLIFVLFIIAIVSVLDLAFGKAIIAVFS